VAIVSRAVTFRLVGELGYVWEVLGTPLLDLHFRWICKGYNNSRPKSKVDLVRGLEVSSVLGPPFSANLVDGVLLHTS